MKLTLVLLNPPPGIALDSNFALGEGSAVVGRDPSCEWTLPDPRAEVSRRHAMIRCRDSGYWIEDLQSLNGIVLESSGAKVGLPSPYRLQDGDVLRIGDYVVRVGVDETSGRASTGRPARSDKVEDGSRQSLEGRHWTPSAERSSRRRTTPIPSSDPLPPPDMHFTPPPLREPAMPESRGASDGLIPDDWDKSRSVMQVFGAVSPAPADPPTVPPRVNSSGGQDDHSRERVYSDVRSVERAGGGMPAERPRMPAAGADSALEKFLAAAGLHELAMDDVVAEQLGKSLRVAIAGLMDLLRARAEVKYQFRMEQTVFQARGNNPLKFAATADQAFDQLFVHRENRNLPAVDAVASGIDDLKWHQLALMAGMRQAIMDILHSFDPVELKARFEEQGGRSGGFGWNSGQRLWEQYESMFEGIRDDMDTYFKRVFGEGFVDEYERQVRELERKHGSRSTSGRR